MVLTFYSLLINIYNLQIIVKKHDFRKIFKMKTKRVEKAVTGLTIRTNVNEIINGLKT